jgi:O-antigen/teichoic acid export membrane protein
MSGTVAVSRRRLTLATATQIGGRAFGALLGVFVAASLARSLSRPAFGELALGLTILALAGSLGDLGINQIAVREMARRPEGRASIAGALTVVQLLSGVVLGLIGTAIAFALLSGDQARVMAVFLMATMPLGAIGALTIASQARLRPELVIIPPLVQNVIWLGAVLALGATHEGLALYGVAAFAAAAVQAAVTIVIAARVTEVTFTDTFELILGLLRVAWPIGLAGMFVTAYYRIDGVLLFQFRGATASAYYSASYRVLDVLQILPMTVSGVLLPLLAGAPRSENGNVRAARTFELASIILLIMAIGVAVLGTILAPGIVTLIYGSAYHRSIYLLQVLLPAFVPICLGYLLTSQLILHGLLRPYIAITFIGAVLNVAVNAIGIPRYGAPVAAWATLGTEVVVMICIATVVRRRVGLRLPLQRMLRCLVAVTLAGAAVWAVRSEPLAVGVLVAVVAYPPCVMAMRVISIAELRSLISRDAAAQA